MTPYKILFKYATRERPSWFLRGIKNIAETISRERKYEILVTVDTDDVSMYNEFVIKQACDLSNNLTWAWGFSKGKVNAINRGMEKAKSSWDILINLSDDMLFQYPNWDLDMEILIKKRWNKSLDFFAHFNDGYTADAIPSMSIMGREYYKRTNRIYPEEYHSLWADNHVKDEAIILNRYHYFPLVFFKHLHPANAGINQDDLYRHNESYYYTDKATYEKFKANNFGL